MVTALQAANTYLQETASPVTIVAGTALSMLAVQILRRQCQRNWGESTSEQIGRWLLKIPAVKKLFLQDVEKQLVHFNESTRKHWKEFEPAITKIPEEGWSDQQLLDLLKRYVEVTEKHLKGVHFSGTIYSNSLVSSSKIPEVLSQITATKNSDFKSGELDLDLLSKRINRINTLIFEVANLWNPLHLDEFGIGSFVKYQVVNMVANMFGATQEVMGFVTSGGTESMMTAARAYRNWGRETYGHQPGQSVIIAPKTIHASLLKAGDCSFINIVEIPCDENDNVDLNALDKLIKKHGKNVVAIFASAPSYSLGRFDPIKEIAQRASQLGCGFHVDCCLGAFVINHFNDKFLRTTPNHANFLSINGVTSLSADTHKNGGAPKGSSVLVTQTLGEKNLAWHAIYSMPNLRMGVYGSPNNAGSESCLPALHAFFTMLTMGQSGYKEITRLIQLRMEEIENYFYFSQSNDIRVLNKRNHYEFKAQIHVIGFKLKPEFGVGATYVFAKHMKENGFVLSKIQGDQVHFCITARFAADKKGFHNFAAAVKKSLDLTAKEMQDNKTKGIKLSGDAGMYCQIESAVNPSIKELNVTTYIRNYLFGKKGAVDAVKAYFYAQMNPYDKDHPPTRVLKQE